MAKKQNMLNYDQLSHNITTLMNHCEIDAVELSRETGLPTSTISRLRSSMVDSSPNLSSLIPIARYFEISVSQLIGEELLPAEICGNYQPSAMHLYIPVLNNETFASFFATRTNAELPSMCIDFHASKQAFAYHHLGSAMEPLFPTGTCLIADPERAPKQGDYVLVVLKGEQSPLFRQFIVDGDHHYLRALNPAFNELIRLNEKNDHSLAVVLQSRMDY